MTKFRQLTGEFIGVYNNQTYCVLWSTDNKTQRRECLVEKEKK